MSKWNQVILVTMIAFTLVSGCRPAIPVVTPALPTPTQTHVLPSLQAETPEQADTPIPPTPAPLPLPSGGGSGEIAFVSERDGMAQIYVMSADGSDQRYLTQDRQDHWYPHWSPDGESIVFHSHQSSNAWSN